MHEMDQKSMMARNPRRWGESDQSCTRPDGPPGDESHGKLLSGLLKSRSQLGGPTGFRNAEGSALAEGGFWTELVC